MPLPDILLGLLREPMSGSDLIRLFQGTTGHFWQTDLSQIYRALEALERDGCLTSRSLPSARGPARRVYRLTGRGRRRLTRWLHSPAAIPAAKFEYLAQLFSLTSEANPRQRALEILESLHSEAARSLAELEVIERTFRDIPGYPEGLPAYVFYPWLTLRHGLARRRALVEWITEAVDLLARRPASADADAGPEAMSRLVRELQAEAMAAGHVK